MDRRPPLAVSPRRLRPRPHRAVAAPRPPVACSVQTPPGSIKKATTPMRSSFCALPMSRLEPTPRAKLEFAGAPSPARAAAAGKENRHVDDEVALDLTAMAMPTWTASPLPPTSPLFERGRLYDLYSARRNERLKRKHGFPVGEEEAEAMAADPCVAVELSKRRGAKKMTGAESVRRSMPAAAAVDFSAANRATSTLGLRSTLRSSKEMKKASAASSSFAGAKSSAVKERRASTRSSARRF